MINNRTPHFVSIKSIFSNFVFLTVKSPSVTQRSVSQENAFKENKNPSPFFFFFCKTIDSNGSFILIESIQVFKISKFEFKVTGKKHP